jgi:hypothetical protein
VFTIRPYVGAPPVRRRVPRQQEVPAQVDPDHQVPLLVGHVEQHPVAQHPGVVHHDVQPAELLGGGGEQRVRGGSLGHVTRDEDGFTARRLDLVDHPGGVRGHVVHHDIGARPGERESFGSAEPRPRAGDDGDLPVERCARHPYPFGWLVVGYAETLGQVLIPLNTRWPARQQGFSRSTWANSENVFYQSRWYRRTSRGGRTGTDSGLAGAGSATSVGAVDATQKPRNGPHEGAEDDGNVRRRVRRGRRRQR